MLIEENKRDCILDNFKLINQKEIIDFIRSNTGLLELIEKVYPLLESYFPDYFYSLSYATDPEIKDLDGLVDVLKQDDPRRAIQIPSKVLSAGIQANPRN